MAEVDVLSYTIIHKIFTSYSIKKEVLSMMLFFRFIVIGFFSLTALSLFSFQSIEIFQAFVDSFFQNK